MPRGASKIHPDRVGPVPMTRIGIDCVKTIQDRLSNIGRPQSQWMIIEQALYRYMLEVTASEKDIATLEGWITTRWPEYVPDGRHPAVKAMAETLERERILARKTG
jgi:hypothetical protein